MKKVILAVAVVLCVIFIGDISWAFAQGVPIAPAGSAPVNPGAPIGGIVAAAAVGGAYAVKKLRDRSKV